MLHLLLLYSERQVNHVNSFRMFCNVSGYKMWQFWWCHSAKWLPCPSQHYICPYWQQQQNRKCGLECWLLRVFSCKDGVGKTRGSDDQAIETWIVTVHRTDMGNSPRANGGADSCLEGWNDEKTGPFGWSMQNRVIYSPAFTRLNVDM
jgi:hypothetical protein